MNTPRLNTRRRKTDAPRMVRGCRSSYVQIEYFSEPNTDPIIDTEKALRTQQNRASSTADAVATDRYAKIGPLTFWIIPISLIYELESIGYGSPELIGLQSILKDEEPDLTTMRFGIDLLLLCFAFVSVNTEAVQDKCPKTEYACLDVINSSQCIEQLVIERLAPVTKEAMVKCVEYEGTVTNLPGATKFCRCPGWRLRGAPPRGDMPWLIAAPVAVRCEMRQRILFYPGDLPFIIDDSILHHSCCIDNQRRAEAINPMFRSLQIETVEFSTKLVFKKSRRFTHIGALEGLNAPGSVNFLPKEGLSLHNQQSLKDFGKPTSFFTVDECMSSAARRVAKREEDVACVRNDSFIDPLTVKGAPFDSDIEERNTRGLPNSFTGLYYGRPVWLTHSGLQFFKPYRLSHVSYAILYPYLTIHWFNSPCLDLNTPSCKIVQSFANQGKSEPAFSLITMRESVAIFNGRVLGTISGDTKVIDAYRGISENGVKDHLENGISSIFGTGYPNQCDRIPVRIFVLDRLALHIRLSTTYISSNSTGLGIIRGTLAVRLFVSAKHEQISHPGALEKKLKNRKWLIIYHLRYNVLAAIGRIIQADTLPKGISFTCLRL
ncbi:uncharacterized protein BDR25DRAFT_350245 [Lindgomyces ingoldianus]|uniref:Uncharacterized protein n=1 Tax=Lindgomyces ingoldianus TaxID=673940 RepID=A0ACB6RB28_9PLEO|nr:uncharacterized protein BDR25DRAFT_350245 [Lindgomyces ingoldianus]KAF2475958.1 hypothetical protein BDR25DRAFT_350245 [Lindgomyces ingoldianus]